MQVITGVGGFRTWSRSRGASPRGRELGFCAAVADDGGFMERGGRPHIESGGDAASMATPRTCPSSAEIALHRKHIFYGDVVGRCSWIMTPRRLKSIRQLPATGLSTWAESMAPGARQARCSSGPSSTTPKPVSGCSAQIDAQDAHERNDSSFPSCSPLRISAPRRTRSPSP